MDVLEEMAEEPFIITTADMLEIAASGGNGSEYVDIVGLMENAAKELREKDAKIEQLRQQNAELVDALKTVHIWVVRWTGHVGRCDGGIKCTCGRTRAIYEAEAAIAKATGEE